MSSKTPSEQAIEAMSILLEARGCLFKGEPEIPEELSGNFDITLDDARKVIRTFQALRSQAPTKDLETMAREWYMRRLHLWDTRPDLRETAKNLPAVKEGTAMLAAFASFVEAQRGTPEVVEAGKQLHGILHHIVHGLDVPKSHMKIAMGEWTAALSPATQGGQPIPDFKNMPIEEVDAYLRSEGIDPDEEREHGRKVIERIKREMKAGKCDLCGELMPVGEEMFKFHGFSGPCPKGGQPNTDQDGN